jgi:hypothetical protein
MLQIFDLNQKTKVVLLVVFIVVFYLIAKAGQIEKYDPNQQYADAPTYEPGWLGGSWAYYSPYRYGYWPYYPLFPYQYYPYAWY